MSGPVHQTVVYRVDPAAVGLVEAAMVEYAEYLAREIPGALWWTGRHEDDPTQFVTVISAIDESTDDELRTCAGTRAFVEVLYANTVEDPIFTGLTEVSTTSPLVRPER